MALRRDPILPEAATNEGQRRLRLLLRKYSFAGIARYIQCEESTIRRWAKKSVTPQLPMRARLEKAPQVRIPEWTWDEPPLDNPYAGGEPETTRR